MRATASRSVLSLALEVTRWATFVVFAGLFALASSASAAADLKITSPAEGATISGSDVTVTIEVDAILVPPPKAAKKDDLHVIFALDVDTKPFLEGTTKLGRGSDRVHTARKSVTFTDIAPGAHNVTVILVNSDHTAVQPPVAASVRFVVAN